MPSTMPSSPSGWVDATAWATIQLGQCGRGVGLDYRKVPEVTGVAVSVTGGLHVGVVLMRAPPTHTNAISSAAATATICFVSTIDPPARIIPEVVESVTARA